ncbi:MAG: multiple sugar transport system substrate-binding protein [Thermomicrobiales bacterium]|nr:multiple sugar transport system substrate-binding protein [Thermomicrobiales bacterium]
MAENTEVRELWRDALTGKISRRDVMRRGLALGLSAPVLAALAQETVRGALAATEGTLSVTYYQWIVQNHPTLERDFNPEFTKTLEAQGMKLNAEVAPVEGFGFERFLAEAQKQDSTWDFYLGVTPFLEMIQLADSGTIEPWDEYLPAGLLDDLPTSIKDEGTYKDKFYVWPFLLDVIVQGWNAEQVAKAGLDPEVAPKNWDEFIANATKVKESGAARFGATFDRHPWRSLIPITHSIKTDVYDPTTGIFLWNSDEAVQALEIMKRIFEVANPDLVNPGNTDGGVNDTPDERAFAAQGACYYVKYQNAHLRFGGTWPDPSQIRISALPVQDGGAGGTVFWDTGAVLFTYGKNKPQAAEYVNALTHNDLFWQRSISGNPAEGEVAPVQLWTYKSLWEGYRTSNPEWLQNSQWVFSIYDGLDKAKAIAPSKLAFSQFTIGLPFYLAYLQGEESDPKAALTKAYDAVMAEYNK